jgi:putative ABC transport system substrate-binding protein
MKRRDFIRLAGGAACWPVAARAQQPRMPVIGWLSGRNSETDEPLLIPVQQGLAAHGYVEGRNARTQFRWADGDYDRLPALARDLLNNQASVVISVGAGLKGIQAVRAANRTVPIVFIASEDPVKAGLVSSFSRPGRNLTGVTSFFREVDSKRLGLMHQLLPNATKIVAIRNSADVTYAPEVVELERAATALGKKMELLNASNDNELDAAFTLISKARPDALYFVTSPYFFSRADRIIAATRELSIPTFFWRREFAAAGGLMSYGSRTDEGYRVLGEYAARILNGTPAGDLPIQQPTKLDLVINLKTVKALGIIVPPTLLALADEVIE